MKKENSSYNRTLIIDEAEIPLLRAKLRTISSPVILDNIINSTINQNINDVIEYLPPNSIDLLFLDPPYNLERKFGETRFKAMNLDEYEKWFEGWFVRLLRVLKTSASVYICCDWKNSAAIHNVIQKHLGISKN